MTSSSADAEIERPKAMATVTECRYEAGALQVLAFGIPVSRHFQITFNYWVDGELHTGQFNAAKAVPQGTFFRVSYDPAAPHLHDKASDVAARRRPLVVIGILGSVVLSLAWIAFVRGCA